MRGDECAACGGRRRSPAAETIPRRSVTREDGLTKKPFVFDFKAARVAAHRGHRWRSRPGRTSRRLQKHARTRVSGADAWTANGHLYGSDVEAVGVAINAAF